MNLSEKFKSVTCEHCNKKVDPTATNCPRCGEELLNPEEKKPFLNDIHCGWVRNLTCFLTGWAGLQVFSLIFSLILQLAMGVNKDSSAALKASYMITVQCVSYGFIFLALIAILWPYLKEIFRSFKGWKPYVAGVVGFIVMIGINIIWNLISKAINPATSSNENQQAVVSMTKSFPALSILFFGLIGPIVEEITYRVGLFGLAKRVNRVFAYIIVPIVFGFIHFDFESIGTDRFLNEILNMPTYILGGLALTFLYDRFGFAASSTTHILNNLWATIASLIPSGK